MRKVLIGISPLLPLYQASPVARGSTSDHLTELKSKYPYGLLSDDYGVLTLNDLALNACQTASRQRARRSNRLSLHRIATHSHSGLQELRQDAEEFNAGNVTRLHFRLVH